MALLLALAQRSLPPLHRHPVSISRRSLAPRSHEHPDDQAQVQARQQRVDWAQLLLATARPLATRFRIPPRLRSLAAHSHLGRQAPEQEQEQALELAEAAAAAEDYCARTRLVVNRPSATPHRIHNRNNNPNLSSKASAAVRIPSPPSGIGMAPAQHRA